MRTLDIPGGTATFRERGELTVGGSRAVARATRHLPKRMLDQAKPAEDEGKHAEAEKPEDQPTDLLGFPVEFSDDDLDAAWEFNDVMILATLDSWTLARPLPSNRDELEALPADLYGGLQQAIAVMQRNQPASPVDEFSVDAVEDRESPTGA